MLNNLTALLDSGAVAAVGDYESISTVTVGAGGSSSIAFTSIPSTYKHLQVRFISRCSRVDVSDSLGLRFNSDSGSNYTRHGIYGNNSVAGVLGNTGETLIRAATQTATNAPANSFGAGVWDILDYASTSKYKTIRVLSGLDDTQAAESEIRYGSGLWLNTAAVTSITFLAQAGSANFSQYSSFALYGVK